MKTLLFTLEYPPFNGGVANYYGNLVKYYSDSNIFVLHNNDNKLIKNWLYPKWLPAIWQLWKTIKKEKVSHIIVGHILPLGTVAYFVSRITKTPYSVILHGMDFTFALRSSKKRKITKRILMNAKNIICGNSYVAGLVKEFVGDEYSCRIEVVNPGITVLATRNSQLATQIKNKYNLENKIVLLTIGRLVKRKGVDKVLESLPAVLGKVPNLVYAIAGSGPDQKYLKQESVNLDQNNRLNVVFLDKITEEEKWAWLNLCDIFIMPARMISGDFEGFGIVYLEANLAGKPVIAGNSGGVRDAVENNVNGLLVDPENTDEISNAIIKLAQDESLRKKLGEQGMHRTIKEFSWESQVRKIYKFLNSN